MWKCKTTKYSLRPLATTFLYFKIYFDTNLFTERLDVKTIEHAHIIKTIKFVKDGDSYDVECADGYEVAQGLKNEYRYIGGEQNKVKTFNIQNRNDRYVYLVRNDEYTNLVCRKGKQRIRDKYICT